MKRRSLLVGGASLVAVGATARTVVSMAAATDGPGFASSFEPGDPAPDWTNSAETGAGGQPRMSGVTGWSADPLPGSVAGKVSAVTASADNPPSELAADLADGDANTKWLTRSATGWAQFDLAEPIAIASYALTSANDEPDRDPKSWTLAGSTDGTQWTQLDARDGQDFTDRYATRQFDIDNTTAYRHYRLTVTANHGADALQLAELQLSTGDGPAPAATPMRAFSSRGPANGPNMLPYAGFTGLHSLEYSGRHTTDGRGYAYDKVFAVDVDVQDDTELTYLIFPELTAGDLDYPSTYVALDLAFSDGTYLSELGATDEHGIELSPSGQGTGKILYADQWNQVRCRIGTVAAGKTVKRILVGYDNPHGPTLFHGWIDDIAIAAAAETGGKPTDFVVTTRGTNASGDFSRGNTVPATAVPNGFNFWTPVTDASSLSWLYRYQADNDSDNLPRLQAFSACHEPSPWIGDRQSFQVLPAATSDKPNADRSARALTFRHSNETARAHYYSVMFDNGIRTEIAPTDHAAVFRFTFPADDAALIFDNVNNSGGLTLDPGSRSLTGYSDVNIDNYDAGASRMFVYATFDRPVTASGKLSGGGGADVTGYFRFDAGDDRTVTMRIATSLLGIEQAKHNMALEIADSDTLDTVRDSAERLWLKRLNVIEVEGASADALTTLYSNLYRLNLYPNSMYENAGTASEPDYRYASPVSPPAGDSTPTTTGATVVPGKIYVNNGFWDTYRTAWPLYSLLYPSMAGELVDGFLQQYRDGGWVARWSAPGYADAMTGTSSDVAFADAFLKGVKGFDPATAYEAAVRNASAPSSNSAVGRKGLTTSIFLGYTTDSLGESVSWALEGFINDFGIGNMAAELARRAESGSAAARRYAEESEYYLSRALNYVHLFDPEVGFFQGFDADHKPGLSSSDYDPLVWGDPYTETDGWNFAFHVPHDGNGLANLYGGRDKLAAKLDDFFSTPETAQHPGSYGSTIHEMVEARDVRMGQYGHSNQPSHHITYMYTYAGKPSRTQAAVREVLRRLYTGSRIGEGYPGDEDNGEMSAWWLFSALGFYPLAVGSPRYAIGSPLFAKATVHLENGNDLVITAPGNSVSTVYVQGVTLNGTPYDRAYLEHDDLVRGARLDFRMGTAPSTWATAPSAAPPSLTTGAGVPAPLADVTGAGHGTASASDGTDLTALFDNTSGTQVTFTTATPTVAYHLADPARATFYTLTSGTGSDPTAWTLHGSPDGTNWTLLDQRSAETFAWHPQTRPFKIAQPATYAHYRLTITAATADPLTLTQLELLA